METLNKNFGKMENGKLKYAPLSLILDNKILINPTDDSYFKAGYGRVINGKLVGLINKPDEEIKRLDAISNKEFSHKNPVIETIDNVKIKDTFNLKYNDYDKSVGQSWKPELINSEVENTEKHDIEHIK